MAYLPEKERYSSIQYNRCGKSGIMLPPLALGFWHNFGGIDVYENGRAIVRKAFDLGITHFDLANNYGPPYGSAEDTFGRIFNADFKPYRDEMIIATKAGFDMWPGPYGDKGSKKYLVASIDQSLKRMGLEYVDIFYHHCPDPETPIEETMAALDLIVRQGKALYVGISNYDHSQTEEAIRVLKHLGTPCLINQANYSMTDRWIEDGLQNVLEKEGVGFIAYCPLDQGLLTDKYLGGIPSDSRAAGKSIFLNSSNITEDMLVKVRKLNDVAASRGQSLAQMALAWALHNGCVTSALIGASKVKQVEDNVAALNNLQFSDEELQNIDDILTISN